MNEGRTVQSKLLNLLSADIRTGGDLRVVEPLDYFRTIALRLVTTIYKETEASEIAIYSTGVTSGKFVRLAGCGEVNEAPEYDSADFDIDLIAKLHEIGFAQFTSASGGSQFYVLSSNLAVLYLVSRGEVFGFILVKGFSDPPRAFFEDNFQIINAIMSDQAFSYRMNVLSEPLVDPTKSENFESDFAEHVTNLVTRGFGADGSTFRLRNKDELHVVGAAGLLTPRIERARETGGQLSEMLLRAEDSDWAAIILGPKESYDIGGIRIPDTLMRQLRGVGLYSVLMARLGTSGSGDRGDSYGTLSYYFLRPTAYSRKDVALFRSFSQKVGAYLTMYYALEDLRAQKKIVELQNRYMVHSEVASLLSHDIWHKANSVAYDSEKAAQMFKNGIDRGRITGREDLLVELSGELNELSIAASTLQSTTGRYRRLQTEEIRESQDFSVLDALRTVTDTLSSVLARKNIEFRARIGMELKVHGPRFLFEQVLYNLLINSIDAISEFDSRRRSSWIEVHGRVDQGMGIIRVSDSGPGISYQEFPDIQDVFQIGRTSKKEGSGTGLAAARQVVGSHFAGNLTLSGRRPAIFTITVPAGK